MAPGPDQGIDDDPHKRALLRDDPPAETLAWVSRVCDGAPIVATEPLLGGSTSAMHAVSLRERDAVLRVVLRRYVLEEVLAEEPDIADQEALALRLVDPLAVPTPRLLALDSTAAETDVPALVISELPGRPAWYSRDARRWLPAMADAAIDIHAVAVPADAGVRPFDRYAQHSYEPPRWVADPAVWERAVEIFLGPITSHDVGFIHRDFHPGNVLWHRRRLTGVVDWQAASIGPRCVDIGHCRTNLIFDDPALVAVFTAEWERRSGQTFDPIGDVVTIIGLLDGLRERPPRASAQRGFDEMLGRAVAEIGA
ncbi:MAG: phosphotransferase family protein [Acidimicrobiia bacterium]